MPRTGALAAPGWFRSRGLALVPMAREPAYPVLNTVLWRGGAAPPFEPPAHRAAALMAERRTVMLAPRVTWSERSDRPAKAEAGP